MPYPPYPLSVWLSSPRLIYSTDQLSLLALQMLMMHLGSVVQMLAVVARVSAVKIVAMIVLAALVEVGWKLAWPHSLVEADCMVFHNLEVAVHTASVLLVGQDFVEYMVLLREVTACL